MQKKKKFVAIAVLVAALAVIVGVTRIGGAEAKVQSFGRWGRGAEATATRGAEPSAAEINAAAPGSLALIQEETDNGTFIDVAPRGETVGDYFIFRDRLLDARTKAHVGSLSVQCTNAFFSVECFGTAIIFDRGKITLAGNVQFTDTFAVAITGGTREFRGARGQVLVTDTPAPRDSIVFQLV